MRKINPEAHSLYHPWSIDSQGIPYSDYMDYEDSENDRPSLPLSATPQAAAVNAWVCLTRLLLLALDHRNGVDDTESWRDESWALHSSLGYIEGNICIDEIDGVEDEYGTERYWQATECDACEFARAISAIVDTGIVDEHLPFLQSTFQPTANNLKARIEFDLEEFFALPFKNDPPLLAAILTPARLAEVQEECREAVHRIGWLKNAKCSNFSQDGCDDQNISSPIGGWITRIKVALVIDRDPKTLKNWESMGKTPNGISWPKGERQGNMVYYQVEQVWPSILAIMPDIDRAKQKLLLESIMELRNTGD